MLVPQSCFALLGRPACLVTRIAALFFVLFGSLALTPTAVAQYDTATVVGTIIDPHGLPVSGAEIALHNVDLGTTLTRKSNSTGSYEFSDIQIGTYTVSVNATGFAESVTKPFDLVVSARQRMDMPLKVGTATDTVTVSVDTAGLQTESGEKSTTIESEQIVDLPLNGREYADLALLSPGVQVGAEETIATDTYRRASFVTNANRSSVNNFLLDGLDNNSYEIGNEGFNNQLLTESVDAVQQFAVTTSNFSAEYGRDGGAIINVKSRSGTDKLHFSLYEFLRNTIFDAYGPFYGTGVKPALIQNQFGGTVGAAIPKVKDLFYFVGYEGFRQATRTLAQQTMPTAAEMTGGIFLSPLSATNSTPTPTPLENPLTGKTYPLGMIPLSDYTPFAAAVFAALPMPNVPNAALGAINFQENEPGHIFRDVFDIRLDKYVGNRLQTFARFAKQQTHMTAVPTIPGAAGGEGFGHMRILTSSGAAGTTYVLTPNSLIDVHVGVNFENAGKVPYNSGDPNFYSALNIPNPAPELPMAGLNSQVVDHLVSFGMESDQPQFNNPQTYNIKTNYTLAKGRHSYSFGYEWLLLNEKVEEGSNQYGEDEYAGKFSGCSTTACPGATQPYNSTQRAIAYNLADFIFGARSSLELSTYNAPVQFYDFDYVYGQDSWKVSSRLTVQYGLRYEFATPERSRTAGQPIVNFDPNAQALQIGKPGSIYDEALVHPKLNNFAPRFGFAYSFYPNIVFRGGYGLSYIQWNRGYSDLLSNPPNSVSGIIDQTPSEGVCPTGSLSFTCFRPTMQGYPSSLNSTSNFSTTTTEVQYKPSHLPTGYVETYSLGTQVQMTPQTILNLAYVGVHDVHTEVLADYNEAAFNPVTATCNATTDTGCTSIASRRPISNFTDIQAVLPYGFLRYNSLQAQVTHQAKGGFYLLNSFTWSRGIDNTSGTAENSNGDSALIDLDQPTYTNGLSGYNQPINDSLALVWRIPYGQGINNHVLRQTARGWTITTITRLTSGLPINVTYGPSTTQELTDLSLVYRPNYTGLLNTIINPRSQWTRSATGVMNVITPTTSPSSQIQIPGGYDPNGNMPRNALTGPGFANVDLGLQKNFVLPHNGNFQFRTEAYNIMNHTNYKTPNSDASSGTFGEITSAFASRVLQFAVRVSY